MNPTLVSATASRVLRQLRHDHRSVALVVLLPVALLGLVHEMLRERAGAFGPVALALLAVFPCFVMFLVTSIATLRERTGGTLERLLTTPLGRLDLLLGYAVAFGLVAVVQAAVVTVVAYGVLGLETAGAPLVVVLVAVLDALLGVALGLLCSAFARTEFQAVQFLPVVVLPQVLLCGLLVPRDRMAPWLEHVSAALPLTYAVEALHEVGVRATPNTAVWTDVVVVGGAALAALALAAATLQRQTE